MNAVMVRNADRMMTSAKPLKDGIEVAFADGRKGLVPFAEIPQVEGLEELANIELPNPYEIVLETNLRQTVELPWDFARHYCDTAYRPRVEAIAAKGKQALGSRLRRLRGASGITQEKLAATAGIGRVTLVRIEKGEQSPRYETLVALARALGRPVSELLV